MGNLAVNLIYPHSFYETSTRLRPEGGYLWPVFTFPSSPKPAKQPPENTKTNFSFKKFKILVDENPFRYYYLPK